MEAELTEQQLNQIYEWVDQVPLSRPKRNMARDFSDAVLFAEIVEHYNPKIVELHNYNATGALPQKVSNWKTLNSKIVCSAGKVLAKLKMGLRDEEIESLANSSPHMIEKLIYRFKKLIEKGEIDTSASVVSKISKANTSLSFGLELDKPKKFHKMPYSEIKKHKNVEQLTSAKEDEVKLLKSEIGLLMLKSVKLQQMLKCKDRQIQQLVSLIKSHKR